MEGNEVYKYAVNTMQMAAEKAISMANISSEDIKWFIPHQANIRIIDTTAKYLKVPKEKVL